jgi:hypothetical protein
LLAVGRRPTKHLNLPSRLRARTLPSGRTYYYYDTGEKPRREIPLGNDYALAVKKWAELEIDARPRHADIVTFRYVAERYRREVLPTKAPRTQRDNMTELAQLYKFFDAPPAPIEQTHPSMSGSSWTGARMHRCVPIARRRSSLTSSTRRANGAVPQHRIHAQA